MAIRKTANTDVIHATWEDKMIVTSFIEDDDEVVQMKCSNCKKYSTDICIYGIYGISELKYCSHCGAKMR